MDVRFRLISAEYDSPASFWSSCFVSSSLAASASLRIPWPLRQSEVSGEISPCTWLVLTLFVAGCDSST